MPDPDAILAGLTRIANQAFALAVLWHVAIGVAAAAVASGMRPSRRWAAAVLVMPLISVSVLAWAHGNPFNGATFAVLSVVLLSIAARGAREPIELGHRWAVALGLLLVGFACVYPHFLVVRPQTAYLYGAPVGTIPCPTLALVIGVTLIAGGITSPSWTLVLSVAGSFYALFGLLRLGVVLDIGLLAGVIGILVQWVRRRSGRLTQHDRTEARPSHR